MQWRRGVAGIAMAMLAGTLGACQGSSKLDAPQVTIAPYSTERGEMLWAVVPLRNESGTREADVLAISDQVVQASEEIEGVRTVPLNRTIEAMRAIEMQAVRTPADAKKLAQAMGVDAIVVGSVTSYDPYTPTLGMAISLYVRPGLESLGPAGPIDTRTLSSRPTTAPAPPERAGERPVSSVSANLDGKNHQVLSDIRQYAVGRHDPESASGWMRYTKSMPLYTEFAAHHMVARLVGAEWVRLATERVRHEREKEHLGSRSESRNASAEREEARETGTSR